MSVSLAYCINDLYQHSNRCQATQLEATHTQIIMSEFGDEPEGTFSIFFAEGEALAKQGQYKKAIESFTKVKLC